MTPEKAYVAHQAYLIRIAGIWTRSPAQAEDLVGDMWVLAIAHWDKFREESSRKTWLFRVLRNTFLTQVRRQRVLTDYLIAEHRDFAPALFDSAVERSDRINRALGGVNPATRQQVLAWAERDRHDTPMTANEKLTVFRAFERLRARV